MICAYLRMPYTPPPPETPQVGTHYGDRAHGAADSPSSTITTSQSEATPTDQHQQSRQEREVRLTAQGILARNLRLPNKGRRRWWTPWRVYREPAWPGIRLNLTGALLLDVSLRNCRIAEANFTGARFTGTAFFGDAQFTGTAFFDGAQFTGEAYFADARFTDTAVFGGAQFTDTADFAGAQFTGWINFAGVEFTSLTSFAFAQFTKAAVETGRWPPGWTTRPAQPDKGEDPAFRYLVRSEDDTVG